MIALPRLVTLATTAIVLATSAQECETNGQQKACGMEVHITAHSNHVFANARAACDPPPHSHFFTLELEFLGNEPDEWQRRKRDTSDRVPRPGHNVRLHAVTGCIPGTYRATATARGKGPDGLTFEFEDSTSDYFDLDDCRRRTDG